MTSQLFVAVDLTRLSKDDLRFRPNPVSAWPTVTIDVRNAEAVTCIASWRRDVRSASELSNRLSECAWDALTLGFSYMLCDIVSIPQDAPDLSEKIIGFSKLYASLHAVIAYEVDDDMKRVWLAHEARQILESPTQLYYALLKWQLRVPLRDSLVINQICGRRLGFRDFNTANLHLCDRDDIEDIQLKDLHLLDEISLPTAVVTMSLDRRRQQYASDALLVYELGRSDPSRYILIAALRGLQSNSVGVPALAAIWAMIEGLAVSVRGCDWDVDEVVAWIQRILRDAGEAVGVTIRVAQHPDAAEITFDGRLHGRAVIELVGSSFAALEMPTNLIIRCKNHPAVEETHGSRLSLLAKCVSSVRSRLDAKHIHEPAPLSENAPPYELGFDETPGHDHD